MSQIKRGQAVVLHQTGHSQRQIAVLLGCSRGGVANALNRFRETGSHKDRPRPGTPRVTTGRQDRASVVPEHVPQSQQSREGEFELIFSHFIKFSFFCAIITTNPS